MTNSTYDMSAETEAAVTAADTAGLTDEFTKGNLTAAETAVIGDLISACKGRGIRPLALLLAVYKAPANFSGIGAYGPALAAARGATL